MQVPVISVAAATGLVDAIATAGGNADQILGVAGLDRAALDEVDGFIPANSFARALEEAAQVTGDDCFGLHFGEHFDPKDIGALVYVVIHSPTMQVAIRNTERYLHIHNTAVRLGFSVEGDRGYLRYWLSDPARKPERQRQHNEYSMVVAVKTFRIMAGRDWTPQEIQFAHETPQRVSEHSRVFGCPVLFGCTGNAFAVKRDFGERRVPTADAKLYRVLKQHVERIASEMPSEDDLVGSVRKAIGESVGEANPTLGRMARKLATSPRTLERRLKEQGVIYRELVDDTRRRFALEYLKDRSRTLTEVAFLLGYSEVSAFSRAFKRWTGSTPLEHRVKSVP